MAGNEQKKQDPGLPRLHDTIRLSADGFAKVLGDLEARVMRAVWDVNRPAPAREIYEIVIREHEVAILTVVTVLNKLVKKDLLRRDVEEGLLHYEACWSEDQLRNYAARRVVDGILSFGPAAFATSFVDALAETDPAQLAELERLVRRRLREEEG